MTYLNVIVPWLSLRSYFRRFEELYWYEQNFSLTWGWRDRIDFTAYGDFTGYVELLIVCDWCYEITCSRTVHIWYCSLNSGLLVIWMPADPPLFLICCRRTRVGSIEVDEAMSDDSDELRRELNTKCNHEPSVKWLANRSWPIRTDNWIGRPAPETLVKFIYILQDLCISVK